MRLQDHGDFHQPLHSGQYIPNVYPSPQLPIVVFRGRVIFIEDAVSSFPVYYDAMDGIETLWEDCSLEMPDITWVVEMKNVLRI